MPPTPATPDGRIVIYHLHAPSHIARHPSFVVLPSYVTRGAIYVSPVHRPTEEKAGEADLMTQLILDVTLRPCFPPVMCERTDTYTCVALPNHHLLGGVPSSLQLLMAHCSKTRLNRLAAWSPSASGVHSYTTGQVSHVSESGQRRLLLSAPGEARRSALI